jgi:hypothetical protein
MRGERFKYIHNNYKEELYDLISDPDERYNLADVYPAYVAALRQKGMAIAKSTPIADEEQAKLTKKQIQELRNLGYLN